MQKYPKHAEAYKIAQINWKEIPPHGTFNNLAHTREFTFDVYILEEIHDAAFHLILGHVQ